MSSLAHTVSILRSDTANPEDKYDHEIQLVDHTRPRAEEEPGELSQASTFQSELQRPPSATASRPLSPKWPHGSLRGELAKRKYRKWQEDRVADAPQQQQSRAGTPAGGVDEASTDDDAKPPESPKQKLPSKRDTFRRQRHAVKDSVRDAIRGPRPKHVPTRSACVFDVLYENQRGAFLFGLPMFSSKSLLNFDPTAWQTATFHASPVDITNAQLPDPGWAWAEGWRNWYVDMSGDVDEEGWRYSFAFGQRGRFSWHGTHPWFHSFVRRRRWVRLRVKRGASRAAAAWDSTAAAVRTMDEAHMLNSEYFTIHNAKTATTLDEESTAGEAKRQSAATSKRWSNMGELDELPIGDMEIKDISTLLQRLRKAPIDREKVTAVRVFLEQGGEELYYLAENMRDIMSLFVFQSSRRQLLALLLKKSEQAIEQQERESKRKNKAKETADTERGDREKHAENMRRAVEAADEECKRLEYWSDVRDVVRDGEVVCAVDDQRWGKEWAGLDKSGPESRETFSPRDSDEGEGLSSPVGQTTVFADDVDDGRRDPGELDGTSEANNAAESVQPGRAPSDGDDEPSAEDSEDLEAPDENEDLAEVEPEAEQSGASTPAKRTESPGREDPNDPEISSEPHEGEGDRTPSGKELNGKQSRPSLKDEDRPMSWIEQAWG